MPTIKRLMDAAIVAMLVVDVMLTVLFFERRRTPGLTVAKFSTTSTISNESVTVTTGPSNATSAMFLLLRTNDVAGPQPYVCPSSNAQKWDYGGGSATAQNWVNWNGKSGQLIVNQSISYDNPYPASSKP